MARFVGLSTLLPARVSATDRIDLGFAEWAVPTRTRIAGAQVHALVRPEHVLADPPVGTPNCLTGRSSAQRYFGAVTRNDFHVSWAGQAIFRLIFIARAGCHRGHA